MLTIVVRMACAICVRSVEANETKHISKLTMRAIWHEMSGIGEETLKGYVRQIAHIGNLQRGDGIALNANAAIARGILSEDGRKAGPIIGRTSLTIKSIPRDIAIPIVTTSVQHSRFVAPV